MHLNTKHKYLSNNPKSQYFYLYYIIITVIFYLRSVQQENEPRSRPKSGFYCASTYTLSGFSLFLSLSTINRTYVEKSLICRQCENPGKPGNNTGTDE